MSKWIKKDDNVVVISGNDKGKVGKVLIRRKDRVVVQGVNVRKRHVKRTQKTQTAQIIDMELPIHISNVALCEASGKKLKLRLKTKDDGSKALVYANEKNKEQVYRTLKKGK